MDPKTMTIEQVETRLAEIRSLLDGGGDCDITALTAEVEALQARRAELKSAETARRELRSRVASGEIGDTPQPVVNPAPEARTYTLDSPEYRTAWLKHISGRALTETEQRALTTGITGNTEGTGTSTSGQALYVPTEIQNRIFDLISVKHALVGDITTLNSNTVIDIPYADSMSEASITAEGSAAGSETSITFGKLTLAGKEFTAWITLTYATQKMALPALENFVVTQLANRIGDKVSKDIVATVKNAVAGAKYVKDGMTFADITAMFGQLKRNAQTVLYMTRKTLFTQVVSMVGSDGHPLFQLDPTGKAIGYVLGAPVKFEDALADGEMLLGDPAAIIRNVVQGLLIETDKDIKTHTILFSAYDREESGVIDAEALIAVSSALTPSVDIKEATATVAATETVKLTIKEVVPYGAKVVWTSGTVGKATVAQDGTVTGVASGSSVITATITVGGQTYTDTCTVTVT